LLRGGGQRARLGLGSFSLLEETIMGKVLGSVGDWAGLRAATLLFACSAACSSEGTGVESASTMSSDRAAVTSTTGGALSIDLPNGFAPESTAVLANGQLTIGDRSRIYGSLNGRGRAINVGNQATDLGTQAQVGDLLASGSITLHDQSYVAQNVQAGVGLTQGTGVTIAGSKHRATPLAPKVNRNWLVAFATNAAPVTLNSGQSQTLVPGTYGVVTVNSGGRLTLTAGTYHFESLKLNSLGSLTLNTAAGPIIANVRSELILRSTIQNRQSVASKVLFGYFGTALAAVETGFGGTLVAPNATIKIEGMNGTMHYGAFLGQNVSIQPDAAITHVPFGSWATLPFVNDGTDAIGAVPYDVSLTSTATENVATLLPRAPLTLDHSSIPWQIVTTLPGDIELIAGGARCAPRAGGIHALDCLSTPPNGIRGLDSILIHEFISQGVRKISDGLLDLIRCHLGVCPENAVNRFLGDPSYDVVRSAIKFQVKGAAYDLSSDSIKSPWSAWSDDQSVIPNHTDFYLALSDAVGWLQASTRFTDFRGQPETAMTETGNGAETESGDGQPTYYISYPDAWRLYVWWIAHDIAVDLTNQVPWKLSDMGNYDPDILAPLLDSTELFHERIVHDVELGGEFQENYYDLAWSNYLGATIMSTPRFTFRFISQNGILQDSRYDSIKGLLDWSSANLVHFYGGYTRSNFLTTWGQRYFPTVEEIVNGTVRVGDTAPRHWTAGCHGSTQFYKDVLRAINIPARIPLICTHAEIEFVSEGLFMDHGDDPYNSDYKGSQCTADHLLIDYPTFTSRFGRTVNHNDPETCNVTPSPVEGQLTPESLATCSD
jgi:hypothetical protein